jgi:hypothetical protein
MKIKLLIIISLFLGKTQGQNLPKSLTLNEAIEFGLSNNRSIINADREILKAKKERWKTIAIGLPQISSEINYQNFLEMPVSLVPAEFFGGNAGTFEELTFGTEQNMIGSIKMVNFFLTVLIWLDLKPHVSILRFLKIYLKKQI